MEASRLLLGCALIVVCVLCLPMWSQSLNINSTSTATAYSIAYFEYDDCGLVQGVQKLWAAWSSRTPDLGTNLAGWHATRGDNTDYPCWNQKANWRGISCLRYTSNTTSGDSTTWIIGLSLSDASIAGILPSGIVDFHYLVTLTLTGNPNLTGHIPKELGNLPLNILDLHDNNLNGTIPMELSNLNYLAQLDLGGNQLTGPFPTHFGQTGTLQDYSISRNTFLGDIPQQAFENLTQLLTLDISSNKFSGPLPNLSMLKSLNKLNLSNNGFTKIEMSTIFNGTTIPMSIVVLDLSNLTFSSSQIDWTFLKTNHSKLQELFLDQIYINGTIDITSMSSLNLLSQRSESGLSLSGLQKLSLRNNNITNVISSPNLITNVSTLFYLQGNPYCNYQPKEEDDPRRCYCKQICINIPSDNGRASSLKLRVIITTTVTASSMFLIAMLLVSIFLLRRSQQNLRYLMKKFEEAEINPKRFVYNDLRVATRNFHEDMKLGAGGYGAVYKGILSSNNVVAVKRLFLKTQAAVDSFINEVVLITKLQHRNLVHLKGFCVNGKELLLIYEYVDNHDLDKVLLSARKEKWQVVNWVARMKICTGVAHGLYYLHASSLTKIVHRDIKASNILLDKDMNPKIADFGLARPFEEEKSRITTEHRAGTIGYLAPEYMLWGQLSEKADVYSFGVLLLEIVSGKRNRDPSMPEDQVYLPNRAQIMHKADNLVALIDPRLRLSVDEQLECKRVLEVALMCVQSSVEQRPTMLHVVSLLVGESEIVITPDDSMTWVKYQSEITSIAEESNSGLDLDSSSRIAGSSSTNSNNQQGSSFSHTTSRGAAGLDLSVDMLVMGGR